MAATRPLYLVPRLEVDVKLAGGRVLPLPLGVELVWPDVAAGGAA